MIDQRLQAKLRKETETSRRADDAKKDKTGANRKEEELQLRDSIVRAHFLSFLVISFKPLLIPYITPH